MHVNVCYVLEKHRSDYTDPLLIKTGVEAGKGSFVRRHSKL